MRFVVYDACVLYPAPVRDFVLRLATTGLFSVQGSEHIHAEWVRNVVAQRPELENELDRGVTFIDCIEQTELSVASRSAIGSDRLCARIDSIPDRHQHLGCVFPFAQALATTLFQA